MYPISSVARTLFESENRQVLRITGTDANGTSISVTDANVMMDGFNIDRFSCIGEKLEMGTAIAAQMTLTLKNDDGTYDGILFEGAELFVEIGVADWALASPTVYWIPCGYFTPDEQPRRMNTINLKALDRMARFDQVPPTLAPWTDGDGNVMEDGNGNVLYFNTNIPFPATVQKIVQIICDLCNVPFTQDISGLPNAGAVISAPQVTQQEATYRSYIQWCAGVMGCCAYIDWNGALRFAWYSAADYTSAPSNRFESDLYENDLTFTGVVYTDASGERFVAGTDVYSIEFTGNQLLDGNTATKLANINGALNGYSYRPFSANAISAPWLFPMDEITFTDKDGNDHACAVTNVNFGLNGTTMLSGKGLTTKLNAMASLNGLTQQQQQAMAEASLHASKAVQALDNSLTQQEIFDRLTDGGLEQGLALEAAAPSLGAAGDKKLYLNLDYARFGKLVADFIQGGTLTLGGLDNADGLLEVVDGDGNLAARIDNGGVTLYDGVFSSYDGNGEKRVQMTQGQVIMSCYGPSPGSTIPEWRVGFSVVNRLKNDNSLESIIGTGGDLKLNIDETSRLIVTSMASMPTPPQLTLGPAGISATTLSVGNGASGTFTTADGKTVTVANGIITEIA